MDFYQATRRHVPEDNSLHLCDNSFVPRGRAYEFLWECSITSLGVVYPVELSPS
jgi:hypothetical protein